MTTAIYLRISSADEKNEAVLHEQIRDSDSIKNQRDLLIDFMKNHEDLYLRESEITEIIDDGFSGTNFQRPGIKHLLELAANGKVNCIVVKDFSRFGRNYIEAGNYIEQVFPFLGVRFISVNDGYDSKKEDISAGNLNVAFMNLIHDLYAKDISAKIKSSQKMRWEKGLMSSSFAPFGYIKSPGGKYKIVIDEEAAAVVRQIFNMAADGKTTSEIAKFLNSERIPTPNSYKINSGRKSSHPVGQALWDTGKVRKIIVNEKYTGKAIFGKTRKKNVGSRQFFEVPKSEWIIQENAFEAIVSEDIYIKAQKAIRERSLSPVQKKQKKRQIKVFKSENKIESNKSLQAKEIKKLKKSLRQSEQARILLYEKYKDGKITREHYASKREKINAEIVSLENQINNDGHTYHF